MIHHTEQRSRTITVVKGLPMFGSIDPDKLAKERIELEEAARKGCLAQWKYFWSRSGPGWMQSALTLGAGSVSASLYAGVLMQHKILWVQPVAMFLGIVMFSAMAYQTLCTGARPFDAMRRFTHPALAWAWALAALASTIIWHLPQYALAGGVTADMISAVTGWKPTGAAETWLLLTIGFIYMLIAVFVTWSYGKGSKGVRVYERILKYCVWVIVLSFLAVVIASAVQGKIQWKGLGKGMLPLYFGENSSEVSVIIGALSAAVGVNMTFLFPYTLLARGWGKEHFGLAKFDLVTGMFVPFVLATGLTIIAAGATIYGTPQMVEIIAKGKISAVQAASIFQSAGVPMFLSRIIFGLGVLGMVTSSITMQMLVAGFAICEIFKIEPGGKLYKAACLIPTPAFIGVVTWAKWGPMIAVMASAICGLMLPIAYIGIFWLNNSKAYLQDNTPRGVRAVVWNILMVIAITISVIGAIYYIRTKYFK